MATRKRDRRPPPSRPPQRRAEVLETPRFHGASTRAEPASPEEEQLVRSLGEELAYTMAVVAASPKPGRCDCSVAQGVQRAFGRLRPERRKSQAKRARELLARSPEERRPLFGSFAAPGSGHSLNRPAMTHERRRLLRAAVRARLEAQRDAIQRYHRFAIAGGLPLLSCRTTLEGVQSVELNQYFTDLGISQPETLTFRWFTDCDEAEVGKWEVRRMPSNSLVASGTVEGQNQFTIDFGAFLPSSPGSAPKLYEVRIHPRTKPKLTKLPGDSPSSSEVAKVPSKAVGVHSNPVRIAYAKDTTSPTRFFEEIIFRRLELHLDVLRLVEAQSGLGADEIWLYGSVVESHGAEEIVAHELPKFFEALDGDGAWRFLHHVKGFHLENPSSARWPKIYTVILAVMEQDGGEDIANMMTEMWDTVAGWLLDDIWEEIKDWLEEIGLGTEISGSIVSTLSAIAAALTGSIVGAIAGMVLSFGFGILMIINQAVADDFYELKVRSFVLPVNTEEYIATLGGTFQADGSLQLASEFPRFHYWTMGSIGAYDGLVEVEMHWELTERTDLNA